MHKIKLLITQIIRVASLLVTLFYSMAAQAASCCGGGSAASLVLPKFGSAMVDVSMDSENYYGFWNEAGEHVDDPPGSDLSQTRINAGYAYRLSPNWQAAVVMPYIWNNNQYAGFESNTSGLGDTTLGLWYEDFETIMCVWEVNSIKDLKPAVYYGLNLTVPTGISPYDDVDNSFDITGRGFYRLDGTVLLDKTIYPWNASLLFSYGKYLERPINREYGNYVEPYDKNLGDRALSSLSFGYTQFLENASTITYTLAYANLWEGAGEIDGDVDSTGGFKKRSLALTVAYSNFDKDWIFKATWNQPRQQDGWGENFPTTEIITFGISHVYF